ncbi:DUF2492 domain-containing protein [Campylobacter blaseri]|uniref:Metal-binding protein n=1 Tax=Campylobacter blaseri TaxID=2042961 RepID=A0A2P8QZ21_9BACT|nr:DUF2492 family protein [Campylobacter blaseri]PSM51493.1 metal-binding protein [Campylobacter blaseri]PSM52942.1 metal-binding protein [Campylobacter blaseri]QKF86497.1 DUF2492 domain-containing protein [Campylobacter blaseri]
MKHVHEILINMQSTNKEFESKKEFIDYIDNLFGKDCKFQACSSDNMDANSAYEFLIKKGKIMINDKNKISLHPDMEMCNGHIN